MAAQHPKIKLESDHPIPDGRYMISGVMASLRRTLKTMKTGQSFIWDDNKIIYRAAKEVGVVIKVRKISGEGYRIWKVSEISPANSSLRLRF